MQNALKMLCAPKYLSGRLNFTSMYKINEKRIFLSLLSAQHLTQLLIIVLIPYISLVSGATAPKSPALSIVVNNFVLVKFNLAYLVRDILLI